MNDPLQEQEWLTVTLSDAQMDALADRIAAHLAERLAGTYVRAPLVSAGELAQLLGVSRDTVYQHRGELGARHIGEVGEGKRPRLRFDVENALAAWTARQPGERSHPPAAPAGAGRSRHRRRRAPGSETEMLPIKGRKDQVSS